MSSLSVSVDFLSKLLFLFLLLLFSFIFNLKAVNFFGREMGELTIEVNYPIKNIHLLNKSKLFRLKKSHLTFLKNKNVVFSVYIYKNFNLKKKVNNKDF